LIILCWISGQEVCGEGAQASPTAVDGHSRFADAIGGVVGDAVDTMHLPVGEAHGAACVIVGTGQAKHGHHQHKVLKQQQCKHGHKDKDEQGIAAGAELRWRHQQKQDGTDAENKQSRQGNIGPSAAASPPAMAKVATFLIGGKIFGIHTGNYKGGVWCGQIVMLTSLLMLDLPPYTFHKYNDFVMIMNNL
jgi:hypothetical protein